MIRSSPATQANLRAQLAARGRQEEGEEARGGGRRRQGGRQDDTLQSRNAGKPRAACARRGAPHGGPPLTRLSSSRSPPSACGRRTPSEIHQPRVGEPVSTL